MKDPHLQQDFRSALSLEPLLEFWRNEMVPRCGHVDEMFASFETQIRDNPDLRDDVSNLAALDEHQDMLATLMSVAIPAA